MKVVVLTGPESAGKSTLSKALAERFNAPLVSEYEIGRASCRERV